MNELPQSIICPPIIEKPGYRIYRQFETKILPASIPNARKAAIVDVETTGLDVGTAKIIEYSVLVFEYSPNGKVGNVLYKESFLNDPGEPLSEEVKIVTGIEDSMLQGHKLDWAKIEKVIRNVDLVISHNANFDRKILERYNSIFMEKPWACSYRDIDWFYKHRVVNRRLENLLYHYGYAFNAHRAINDCEATYVLLAQPSLFSELLNNARKVNYRIYVVEGTNWSMRHNFTSRGYYWNSSTIDSAYRGYYIDVDTPEEGRAEIAWIVGEMGLPATSYRIIQVDAYKRYSIRV